MKLFHILAILISLSAVFSFINYRFLKLPTAIGLMLIAMLASLALLLLGPFLRSESLLSTHKRRSGYN